jgi:TonB family protein
MDTLLRAAVVFSAQLLVIVGVSAIAETLARVTDPRLRLAYWRGVALACLALPLSALVAPGPVGPGATFLAASLEGARSVPLPAGLPDTGSVLLWLVSVGALGRLAWLCAGAVRLRQLRQRSRAAVLTPDLEAMRSEMVPRTSVRVSSEIAQPAGFGLRHPVVLLPESFFAMDPAAQRTVACHELLHVARRDWPWIVVEEVTRALFWFNPAVWWLVERIQECREQLVDHLVIARIPSKRAYMGALLAFAEGGRRPAALTTAFLRRGHLRSRLRKLAKESVMSRRRLVWTAAVLACVMAGAIAGTVRALPLAAGDPQQVVDAKEPGLTMPRVISEVKPQYTPEAMRARIEGTVILTAVVRTDGRTSDIAITRSLDKEYGLDEQAVAAIGGWRFEPGRKDGKAVAVRVTIELSFTLKK